MKRIFLLITLVLFLVLTALALWNHGYWGIFEPNFKSFGAAQVFADLVISLTLILVWMWRDAEKSGRNPWPWIFLTMAAGVIGPLVYLILYKAEK